MSGALLLQPERVPLGRIEAGPDGKPTGNVIISREWYRALKDIASAQAVASNTADLSSLTESVAALTDEVGDLGAPDILAPMPAANDSHAYEMTMAPVNWYPAASVALPTFVDAEVPTGAINGTNAVYALAHAPNPASSLALYLNGLRLALGPDYSLAGATITYVSAPQTGDTHVVSYRY